MTPAFGSIARDKLGLWFCLCQRAIRALTLTLTQTARSLCLRAQPSKAQFLWSLTLVQPHAVRTSKIAWVKLVLLSSPK